MNKKVYILYVPFTFSAELYEELTKRREQGKQLEHTSIMSKKDNTDDCNHSTKVLTRLI